MLSEEVVAKYSSAGRIAREVREEVRSMVKSGLPLIELCEGVERLIQEKGGRPAFPCNVGIGSVAAHYTSPPSDGRVIPEDAVVKVDLGVHVDGYVADTAVTVSLNPEHEPMVKAAEDALDRAVKFVHAGVKLAEVGRVIEDAVKSYGFKPIWNLSGHQMVRYVIHTGKSVPNVSHPGGGRMSTGEVYAVEPFVTLKEAAGEVTGSDEHYIYRLLKKRSLRDAAANALLDGIRNEFWTLPFAGRWLIHLMSGDKLHEALSSLVSSKCVMSYPVLIEKSGFPVAQAEHTLLVTEDEPLVITL